jgi:hypothetical protein
LNPFWFLPPTAAWPLASCDPKPCPLIHM